MTQVNFFTEDISFQLKHKSLLRTWLVKVIGNEGYRLTSLNCIFCSDEYLLQINKEYLQHDTYTDIITFDNSSDTLQIEGDIFISIDRVKENAKNTLFLDELHRVMIHGVLHLMGYKDKTNADKTTMREKEDACLSLRQI